MIMLKVLLIYTIIGANVAAISSGVIETHTQGQCERVEADLKAVNDGFQVSSRCVSIEWPPKFDLNRDLMK